MIDSLLKT